MLSEKQMTFLEHRREVKTDGEAAKLTGMAQSTASVWKKVDPEFAAAYARAMQSKLIEQSPLETPEDVRALVAAQMRIYAQHLPASFRRLVNIIQNGSDTNALKAIDLYFKLFRVTPEALQAEELPVVHQQILNWMQVNIGGKDEDRRAGEAEFEGTFRDLSAELESSDSEGLSEL